jgi:hypothetical protein
VQAQTEKSSVQTDQPILFPMPSDADIDRGATVVVGGTEQWYGSFTFETQSSVDAVDKFYTNELQSKGWELLSAMFGRRTVIQFLNRARGRACVITITPGRMWSKTRVEVVVAPTVTGLRLKP